MTLVVSAAPQMGCLTSGDEVFFLLWERGRSKEALCTVQAVARRILTG
jgi:hypothetical protein